MPHRRGIPFGLVTLGALLIVVTTLTPSSGTERGVFLCVLCGPRGGVDFVLNALLFLPLGLGFGLLGMRPLRVLALLAAASSAIELLQATIVTGRHASLRDIVLNAAGGWIGALLAARWSALVHPERRSAGVLAAAWSALFLALQLAGALLARPDAAPSRYYGHLRRPVPGQAPLPALLGDVALSGLPVHDWAFDDSNDVRARLLHEPVRATATLVPVAPNVGFAPVIRIVDHKRRELLLVALRDRDLVLAPRTLATRARLKPLRFALRDAFPAEVAPRARDTLRIEATYARDAVTMRAWWRGTLREQRWTPSASTTWALVSPAQIYAPGALASGVTLCWLAALLLPVGYWLRRATTASRAALGAAMLIGLGLAAVPAAAGLRPSVAAEWAAALAGALTGVALAGAMARRDGVRHAVRPQAFHAAPMEALEA